MSTGNWKERTELLVGKEGIAKLQDAHVLVAGLGGVGGYAAEQLCRAGIGKLTIVDSDSIQSSNRNRQIIALKSTIHQKKTEVFRQRLLDINPEIQLIVKSDYLLDSSVDEILTSRYDYVVDAIDTLTPKVQLLVKAKLKNLRIISSMGAGGKFDPSGVEISDISESHHCRFASVVRRNLRKFNINEGIKVVFSPEMVSKSAVVEIKGEKNKRSVVGTISYMPPIFGCYCASVVIRDILGI
ncbi:MAG TPA: tRNA threonylcarbamoyladenosine dehydratase [Bacteroidales bacterium]|nr:tRNA threonylcarbamoyladenosine dehydratase [Bacteroidales bacterium]